MLLIAITVTVVAVILSAYYLFPRATLIKTAKQLERLERIQKSKAHSQPVPGELDQLLPIVASWSSFYISQLSYTTPSLIVNADPKELIYNLLLDILSKSIFGTTTDALATQLVSSEMTISLIRLRDMLSLYSKRKRLPKYMWLYYDLWDGSMSMENNRAFVKALVHRVRKNIDNDQCFISLMVDTDEEIVVDGFRALFIELMETLPDLIGSIMIELSRRIPEIEVLDEDFCSRIITEVLKRDTPVKKIHLKGHVIDIVSVNSSDNTDLTFGDEKIGMCPARSLIMGILVDLVMKLSNSFVFSQKNGELVIDNVV